MNEGYLGCKKCIAENHPNPSEIRGSGTASVFVGGDCFITCRHHKDSLLEWIEEAKKIEVKK
jgi:hypothetical protein